MFNLQGSEIIIVLLLALVVLGPEKLPDAMRKMGQAYAELKKMSAGFQSEFRAAVDEPLREVRETANVLRDSADFTKLQHGERQEKPKSGEMAELAPADPDAVPIADTPTVETVPDPADGPEEIAESKPAPYADDASDVTPEARSRSAARPSSNGPSPVPAPPPPFTAMSAPFTAMSSASPPARHDPNDEPDAVAADPPADDHTTDDTTGDTAESADRAAGDAGQPALGDPLPVGDTASGDDETDTTR